MTKHMEYDAENLPELLKPERFIRGGGQGKIE